MTTLVQLPDDVLVMVMQYLSVDDLFACRLVCKRLGSVALHRVVWRHHCLAEERPCWCAVLRLAPCLDSIVFSCKVHPWVFTTTSSAVRELILNLRYRDDDFAQGALVLRNQVALGRLRRVELNLGWDCDITRKNPPRRMWAAVTTLLNIVLSCANLESIDLPLVLHHSTFEPVVSGPSSPSLKYFGCPLIEESEAFVNTVLAEHGTTLEEVDLIDITTDNNDGNITKETGDLIVAIPKLRTLQCTMFPGMQALTACQLLRDLSIWVPRAASDNFIDEALHGAAALLRQSERLSTLSVGSGCDESLDKLLPALATSKRPQVERLALLYTGNGPGDFSWLPLLRALPRLPALRQLHITAAEFNSEFENLLLGITPNTAPALRRLEMVAIHTDDIEGGECGCDHAWLHNDGVLRSFLRVNPLVHIHLEELETKFKVYAVPCEFCQDDSRVCKIPEGHRLGLFSHDPDDCPSPEDHIASREWKWVNMLSD